MTTLSPDRCAACGYQRATQPADLCADCYRRAVKTCTERDWPLTADRLLDAALHYTPAHIGTTRTRWSCSNCHAPFTVGQTQGRCPACALYWRRHKHERPIRLILTARYRQEQEDHANRRQD
jgi:hypothetical protein